MPNGTERPKITAKMLNELLTEFNTKNYPQDIREDVRKFSIDVKEAVANSTESLLAVATIMARTAVDPESLALTAFCTGIVLGYRLKEKQIDKIIDDVIK